MQRPPRTWAFGSPADSKTVDLTPDQARDARDRKLLAWARVGGVFNVLRFLFQLTFYGILLGLLFLVYRKNSDNIAAMAINVQTLVSNATTAVSQLPALTANLKLITDAAVLFTALSTNTTRASFEAALARQAAAPAGRRLLGSPFLADDDGAQSAAMVANLQNMTASGRDFLASLATAARQVNASLVNDALAGLITGVPIVWAGYQGLRGSVDQVAKFFLLSTGLVGVAAQVTNSSYPGTLDLVKINYARVAAALRS